MEFRSEYISIGCNRFSNVCDVYRAAEGNRDVVLFGAGKFIALWTIGSAKGVRATLVGHAAQVTTVKVLVTPAGTPGMFVSGDEDGVVKVWQAEDDSGDSFYCITTLSDAHKGSISSLGVGPGGTFASGGVDSIVKIWSCDAGPGQQGQSSVQPMQTIDLEGRLPLDLALAHLPGSGAIILAIALTNRKIHIHTSSRLRGPFTRSLMLDGHEDWIRCLSFTTFATRKEDATDSPSDLALASGSQDGYIRLWRITDLTRSGAVGVQGYDMAQETADNRDGVGPEDNGLNDEMLDDFERKMTGDVAGGDTSNQLTTKSHMFDVGAAKYGISLEALLIGHEGWISNLHWSHEQRTDGTPQLLSTSADSSMIIWSPEGPSSIWYAKHRFGEMSGKGLGLFGSLWTRESGGDAGVLANGWNGGFHHWTSTGSATDAGDEEYLPAWAPTGHSLAVKDLAWDPHGDYLISVSTDQTSRIHANCREAEALPRRWGEMGRPQIHGYDMTSVAAISRTRFVSGADEKVVRVFDAPRGFVSSLNALGVTEDDLHPESRSVGASVPPLGLSNRALTKAVDPASTGDDKGFNQEHISISDRLSALPTEAVLSLSTLWPEIEKLYGHGYELITLAASPSGRLIATACKATVADHAMIRLYDTETWRQVGNPLAGHNLSITRIVFSSDEKYVLSCSRDRTWRLFDRCSSGVGYEPLAAEKPHSRIIWDCAWGPDDTYFATASRDKSVKLWSMDELDERKWKLRHTIKVKDAATAVAICREPGTDRHLLAIGSELGGLEIYRLDPEDLACDLIQAIIPGLAHVDQVHRLLWTTKEGGLRLASCSEDRSVRVTEIAFPPREPVASESTRSTSSVLPIAEQLPLSLDEYRRYGRQMILPGFGLPGQLALKRASIAVVGAGGLGCPALQYLVGAGVGRVSVFDFDKVEISNLHRQILHTSERVGWYKADSAKAALDGLNPHVIVEAITRGVLPATALEMLQDYSLILDCTDRPQTRYLISDASVRLGIPLISGAAIGHSGQWAVYGGFRRRRTKSGTSFDVERRGCYRCIWPNPILTSGRVGAGTCEEEGVWGPVTGIVGVQMAAEAIKMVVGMHEEESRLHLISLDPSATSARSIKIRGPSPKCIACGPSATITDDLEAVGYDAFCGDLSVEEGRLASNAERWPAQKLRQALANGQTPSPLLLDVREATEFGICSLSQAINVQLEEALSDPLEMLRKVNASAHQADVVKTRTPIIFLCRKGNDSQLAAAALEAALPETSSLTVCDLIGGLQAWSRDVDPGFPIY